MFNDVDFFGFNVTIERLGTDGEIDYERYVPWTEVNDRFDLYNQIMGALHGAVECTEDPYSRIVLRAVEYRYGKTVDSYKIRFDNGRDENAFFWTSNRRQSSGWLAEAIPDVLINTKGLFYNDVLFYVI